MPNKKRNSFRFGDLLKVKSEMCGFHQVGSRWKRCNDLDKGKIVIFLSSKLCTTEHWESDGDGEVGMTYSMFIKVIDEGTVKRVRCNFCDVYKNFKLVQKG
jgi:hypothetical protein